MNDNIKELLHKTANIDGIPNGAYNFRVNGASIGRADSLNISIIPKAGGKGIDIHVKPGTKDEIVHIPVAIDLNDFTDVVGNDFYIGENCSNILIVAGCGIHSTGCGQSRHDGIHSFHIGKNSEVTYKETHVGSGSSEASRILNPITNIFLGEGATFAMESIQLEGVDATHRITNAELADESRLAITERLLTYGNQSAKTEFSVDINGKDAKADVVSRSVAKGHSRQEFIAKMVGNNACLGHSECDAIIMDHAIVKAIPEIIAAHVEASLLHEAAIGKIAGEQLVKLMTLGLTEKEAENRIIEGFLK